MNEFQRWEQYAPEAYDAIRQNTDDIAEISRNTGWQEFRIQKIKNHLFHRQHQLDYGFDLFDPDPDIADAWFRLQQGNFTFRPIRKLTSQYLQGFETIPCRFCFNEEIRV